MYHEADKILSFRHQLSSVSYKKVTKLSECNAIVCSSFTYGKLSYVQEGRGRFWFSYWM